jgi:hypothetical protein
MPECDGGRSVIIRLRGVKRYRPRRPDGIKGWKIFSSAGTLRFEKFPGPLHNAAGRRIDEATN